MSAAALVQVVGSSCGVAGGVMEGGEGHVGSGQQAVLFAFENFARRMVHQFPSNPTAQVCLGLMLRRRACHDGTRPVPQALRRQIEQVGGEGGGRGAGGICISAKFLPPGCQALQCAHAVSCPARAPAADEACNGGRQPQRLRHRVEGAGRAAVRKPALPRSIRHRWGLAGTGAQAGGLV